MATSSALRIHVPAEPQQLLLHFQGTPLRLDTVTSSSSGPTRAAGPRRSTTTTSPTSSSSTRGNDGTSAPTQRDQPTSESSAGVFYYMPLTPTPPPPPSSSETRREPLSASPRKHRRTLRQQARQEERLAVEASRFPASTYAYLMSANPPPARAGPTALAGAGPIALDPAIGSFRGRLDTAGSREENVTPDVHAGLEVATHALGTPPAPSTPLAPLAPPPPGSSPMAEDGRPSRASVERAALPPPGGNGETAALPVRCQCGLVRFSTPNVPPVALYHCHCTECQKQSASAFGTSALYPADAFFPLAAAPARALRCWTRPTDAGGRMHCYFCPNCGSRLFHRIVERDGTPRATVSVKAGCIEGLDWHGGKHIYTRSAVVDIPDGAEKYDTLPDEMRREDPEPPSLT